MKRNDIETWAASLAEGDSRVDWQKTQPVTGHDLARLVRAENPEATDADLDAIAQLINDGGND